MLTLTSYQSGAVLICRDDGAEVKLAPDAANRLIMAARMKNIEPFLAKLGDLIPHPELAQTIHETITSATGSDRWNLKEKFARLPTVTTGHDVSDPDQVAEIIKLVP